MKNKTVIRKDLKNGEFTTIHHSILNDSRLTPIAFKLLVSILSDNDDTFKLSRAVYMKRLNITEGTLDSALKLLIKCGYIKKSPTKIKNVLHYTISEYGNLIDENKKEELPTKEKIELTESDVMFIDKIASDNNIEFDANKLLDYLLNSINEGKLTDKSQLNEVNLLKLIKKFKIKEPIKETITDKIIEQWCDLKANGLTKQNLITLKLKVKDRFKNNPNMTEKEIKNKISLFKTEFRKTATNNQD
jgi:DNA-binding MarR family transcriptional regulator